MEAIVAVTYRCNAHCHMCNTWKFPTNPAVEVQPETLEKLPRGLKFANITGGEPFLRDDLNEIIDVLRRKATRLVISTNGYFSERIMGTARRYPDIGFRISLEGLPKTNDELRGIPDCFDHALRSLLQLKSHGCRDIGFGITASDKNASDIMDLYRLAQALNVEFATAVVHNSYYFHKFDNVISRKDELINEFSQLISSFLASWRPKNWLRAYFNDGLINFIKGGTRPLPCNVGNDLFFVDPEANVKPCNAMDETFGNLKTDQWDDIWSGKKAEEIRAKVKTCNRNCWMIGSAAPAIKRSPLKPIIWVLRHKFGTDRNKYGCDRNLTS